VTIKYANNGLTNAGEQIVTITLKAAKGYGFKMSDGTYEGTLEIERTITVTQIEITVTIGNAQKTYGEADPTIASISREVTSGTVLTGEDLGLTIYIVDFSSAVGTYEITGTASNGNYNVTFEVGTYYVYPLGVDGDDEGNNNGGEPGEDNIVDLTEEEIFDAETGLFKNGSFDYDGTAKSLSYADIANVTISYDNNSLTDAGSKTVTITLTAADGYGFKVGVNENGQNVYEGTVKIERTLEVKPKEITVKIDNGHKTYDESAPTASGIGYTPNAGVIGDLGITLYIVDASSAVGTYVIKGTASNGNYIVTFEDGTYYVYPLDVDGDDEGDNEGKEPGDDETDTIVDVIVETDENGKIVVIKDAVTGLELFGDEEGIFVYDGATHELGYAKPANVKEITYSDNNSLTNVGSGTVTVKVTLIADDGYGFKVGVDEKGNNIYKGTIEIERTLTITKKAITVTIGNGSKVYDGTAPTADPNGYTLSAGLVNGQNLGIVLSITGADAAVGKYTITGTASGEYIANYDISFIDGTFEITPTAVDKETVWPWSLLSMATVMEAVLYFFFVRRKRS
jgi:hypothetical protein